MSLHGCSAHVKAALKSGSYVTRVSSLFGLSCRYMDGRRYASAGSHCREAGGWQTSSAPGSCSAPFDRPFGLLLNVAVGGLLPGKAPGADTVFPQTMLVCSTNLLNGFLCLIVRVDSRCEYADLWKACK